MGDDRHGTVLCASRVGVGGVGDDSHLICFVAVWAKMRRRRGSLAGAGASVLIMSHKSVYDETNTIAYTYSAEYAADASVGGHRVERKMYLFTKHQTTCWSQGPLISLRPLALLLSSFSG